MSVGVGPIEIGGMTEPSARAALGEEDVGMKHLSTLPIPVYVDILH
jgi:hypothetical protein